MVDTLPIDRPGGLIGTKRTSGTVSGKRGTLGTDALHGDGAETVIRGSDAVGVEGHRCFVHSFNVAGGWSVWQEYNYSSFVRDAGGGTDDSDDGHHRDDQLGHRHSQRDGGDWLE